MVRGPVWTVEEGCMLTDSTTEFGKETSKSLDGKDTAPLYTIAAWD
jgi:hypothetical protein